MQPFLFLQAIFLTLPLAGLTYFCKAFSTACRFACCTDNAISISHRSNMNRSAAIATFLSLGIALIAYFLMRLVPTVTTPHRVYLDSVATKIVNGKEKQDSVFSKVPSFQLYNQLGDTITWDDLKNKVVVADFFFTTCPSICPILTRNMKSLQNGIRDNNRVGDNGADFVQFISFSVDPERDSVPQLKAYADRYGIDPRNWWLLTGSKKDIYNLAKEGFREGVQDTEVDSAFIHPTRFYLVDRDRVVRARKTPEGNIDLYNGLDTSDVKQLGEDIILLSLEKDPAKKSFLSGKLELLAIVFALAGIGLFFLIRYLNKEKKSL